MEPFYTGPNHDPGLLLPALVDMGWRLAGDPLTPAPPTAEVEPTATPTRRPTVVPPATGDGQTLFVTNFDSATVSVIDVPPVHVSKTIPVGDGPIGVTATADGSTVFVANFHSATVSVISATERRVIDTIPVQGSANSVALSPDESLLYVTDTFTETVSVIDTATHRVVHVIPVRPQPAGVAVVPDGRAFVTDFGSNTLSVVDGGLGEAVALLTLDPFVDAGGPISIAVDPGQGVLWVTAAIDYQLVKVDIQGLARAGNFRFGPAEAIQLSPDGNTAYLAGRFGDGVVKEVDLTSGELRRTIKIGGAPEALAMTPDGARVYVADAGSNLVSFFNTSGISLLGRLQVGDAPMGIALIPAVLTSTPSPVTTPTPTPSPTRPASCVGDCDGDGTVSVAELVRGVNIALGISSVEICPAFDAGGDRMVGIDELVRATANALSGCGSPAGMSAAR